MESLKLSESKWITLSEKGLLLPLLVVFHNRLLLEDVMAMEIDQELVLLIHQTKKLVKGETFWVLYVQIKAINSYQIYIVRRKSPHYINRVSVTRDMC